MAFTFNQYPILTPEQQNPFNSLLSRALETFGKGMHAANLPLEYQKNKINLKYLPREKEAGILASSLGPLAQFVTSPVAQGMVGPQVDQMRGILSKVLSQYGDSGAGQSQPGMATGAEQSGTGNMSAGPAGYANDENIYSRLKKGADVSLSPGGKSKVARSRLAGEAEQLGLPDAVSKALGGSSAAGENAAFEQAVEEGVQRLKMKGYSEATARKALEMKTGESNDSYAKRVRPLFVNEESESPIKSLEQKVARDQQERADAEATAHAFNTTPEVVMEAMSMGIKSAKEFKDFLKWRENNG